MIDSKEERSAVLGFGRVGLRQPSDATSSGRAAILGHYLIPSSVISAVFTITASVIINRRVEIEVLR